MTIMGFESMPQAAPTKEKEKGIALTQEEREQIFFDAAASEERRKNSGQPLSAERASLFERYKDKLKSKTAALVAALAVGASAAVGYGMQQQEVQAQNHEQAVATTLDQLKAADAKFQGSDEEQEARYKRHIGAMSNHTYNFYEEALYHLDEAADAAKNLPETTEREKYLKQLRIKDVEMIRTVVKIENLKN